MLAAQARHARRHGPKPGRKAPRSVNGVLRVRKSTKEGGRW
jgi:hypothetical protein